MHKLKFKFKPGTMPRFAPEYTTCIGGCDEIFNDQMDINERNVRKTTRPNDSGYSSNQSVNSTQRSTIMQNNPSNQRNANTNSSGSSRAASQVRPNQAAQNGISRPQTRPAETARNQNNWSSQTRTNQNPPSQNSRNNQASKPANIGMVASTSDATFNNSTNQNWGNVDGGSTILCNCHDNAILLTVRKEGPNQGICPVSFNRFFAIILI